MMKRNIDWVLEDISMSSFLIQYKPQSIGKLRFNHFISNDASFELGDYQLNFLEEPKNSNRIRIMRGGNLMGRTSSSCFWGKQVGITRG